MGEHDSLTSECNILLSEILVVLKRIDSHLETQDSRIDALHAQIGAFTSSAEASQKPRESSPEEKPTAITDWTSPPYNWKENSDPKAGPRSRDLRLLLSTRNGILNSRDHQGSIATRQSSWSPLSSKKRERSTSRLWGSASHETTSSPTVATISRASTWHSIPPPPTTTACQHIGIDDDPSYSKFPPPPAWVTTRSLGRALDVKYSSAEARALWTSYVGDSWTIPPDGRIEMTFQQHLLERLHKDRVTHLLQTLKDVSNRLEYQRPSDFVKRGSFRVTDFGFDPTYEESAAEYRAEVLIGKYRRNPIVPITQKSSNTIKREKTAPWKRMIEVRGLSKKLIDEHETWTKSFRNPWTEALPNVSPILPFLTDREKDRHKKTYTGMNTVNQALLHHQQCIWQAPQDNNELTFHITFYEVVELSDSEELEGETWRSGKLHGENQRSSISSKEPHSRRIRESACTIVVIPDPVIQSYWTSIYMCPNNFDLYDKVPSQVMALCAEGILVHMTEFTMRMVVERWAGIANYFAVLIGHRDTLSDPDAHDSLLFDDETFSRSRKYFWAINYLAELDVSISENLLSLDRHITTKHGPGPSKYDNFPHICRHREQLQGLKMKLRAQREEAIALRDGLFSASGVMESRASTRLGENVKLLTFVSIFFLPLSFCMSIWSVNNTLFSLHALIVVVILVGLGTYIVVFNLNNVVDVSSWLYDKQKQNLIAKMKDDPDARWRARGMRFATFKPKQESTKPSGWVVGLFVLHQVAMFFTSWNLRWRKDERAAGKEGRNDKAVEQWYDITSEVEDEAQNTRDLPSARNVQAIEVVTAKTSPLRWSRILRRDALTSNLGQQV